MGVRGGRAVGHGAEDKASPRGSYCRLDFPVSPPGTRSGIALMAKTLVQSGGMAPLLPR